MLYLLTRDNADWCEYHSFVIRAANERDAIKIAQEAEEGFNPETTKIKVEMISEYGPHGIILGANTGA